MRAFKTNAELLELLPYLNGPRQLDLKIHVKFRNDIPNPDAVLEVYAHPWPNPKALLTILRQTYTRTWIALHIINDGEMADVDALLEQSDDLLKDVQGKFDDFHIFHMDYDISTHIGNVLSKKFNVSSKRIPCYAFYIPVEKQEEIRKLDIKLPEGFTFCKLNPETDYQFVSSTWPYATKTEAANVKTKLEHLPSIGVKYDGQLVAFEMMHHTGAMNHLYTVPEFRGKGLGTAVELKLVQIIMDKGVMPFKTVSFGAPLGMSLTAKSSYWEKVVDERTKEQIVVDFRDMQNL
uniref:Glycine N-acyltransferase-like protein n=1 Tax=Plectus sambesii TaxID=2011161 RepID=A0A914WU79_9BILA